MTRLERIRLAGIACAAGGALWVLVLGAAVLAPQAVNGSATSYHVWEAILILVQALLLIGVAGLARSGAAGDGWLGRIGLGTVLVGRTSFLLGEVRSFVQGSDDALFVPLGALLTGVGMLVAGAAVVRARRWAGWRRYLPLAAGAYPFVAMFPLLALTGAPPLPRSRCGASSGSCSAWPCTPRPRHPSWRGPPRRTQWWRTRWRRTRWRTQPAWPGRRRRDGRRDRYRCCGERRRAAPAGPAWRRRGRPPEPPPGGQPAPPARSGGRGRTTTRRGRARASGWPASTRASPNDYPIRKDAAARAARAARGPVYLVREDTPMDELLIAYYPWLDTGVAGPADNRLRRVPTPSASDAAPAAAGGGGAQTRRRRRARQSGDSLLPLLFAA